MLIHPHIDPIALQLGPLQIHWYGLTYLAAFTMFYVLATLRARKPLYASAGWTRQQVEDMLFFGVLFLVLAQRGLWQGQAQRKATKKTPSGG